VKLAWASFDVRLQLEDFGFLLRRLIQPLVANVLAACGLSNEERESPTPELTGRPHQAL
jgi:hypothetical protein